MKRTCFIYGSNEHDLFGTKLYYDTVNRSDCDRYIFRSSIEAIKDF